MKLLTMRCIKDPYLSTDSNPIGGVLGQEKYFVKLETRAEQEAYYETVGAMMCASRAKAWWEGYMCRALDEDLDEGEIYYYLCLDEPEPEVGETYTDDDGLVWERIG